MTHKEWRKLDGHLSTLVADRSFKTEQPEEWLAAVRELQAQLEVAPEDD